MKQRVVSLHGCTRTFSQGLGIFIGAIVAIGFLLAPTDTFAQGKSNNGNGNGNGKPPWVNLDGDEREEAFQEWLSDILAGRGPDEMGPPSPVSRGKTGGVPPGFLNPKNPHFGKDPGDLPGAQGIANAQNRGNKR